MQQKRGMCHITPVAYPSMEFWAKKQNASYKSLLIKLLKNGVAGWIQARISFAILRATTVCH